MLRVILNEKNIDYILIAESFWEKSIKFLSLNPSGNLPVMIIDEDNSNNIVIRDINPITEYLEELEYRPRLLTGSSIQKAYIRYITEWFNNKFYHEVTKYILFEKIIKNVTRNGTPNSNAIRAAKKNILYHFEYMNYLLERNVYLCGESLTLADYAAAAHISTLDFTNDVPWDNTKFSKVRYWYSLIKSRPSFKSILQDKVQYLIPPLHYDNPDF